LTKLNLAVLDSAGKVEKCDLEEGKIAETRQDDQPSCLRAFVRALVPHPRTRISHGDRRVRRDAPIRSSPRLGGENRSVV